MPQLSDSGRASPMIDGYLDPLAAKSGLSECWDRSYRWAVAATMGLCGTGAGLVGLAGGPVAAGVALLGVLLVVALVRLMPEDRPFFLALGLAGLGSRLAVAGFVFSLAPALGVSSLVFPDAEAYDVVSWTIARGWGGEPVWVASGDEYLITSYTLLVAGLYRLLGHTPLAAISLNGAFGAMAPLLIARTTRRLFGLRAARVAGVATSFFPSVFFWSVVLLKDAFYLLLVAVVLWVWLEYVASSRFWYLSVAAIAWMVLRDVRYFTFLVLGFLAPVAFFLGSREPMGRRLFQGILIIIAVGMPLSARASGTMVGTLVSGGDVFAALEFHRSANAVGAETAFVAPLATTPPSGEGQPSPTAAGLSGTGTSGSTSIQGPLLPDVEPGGPATSSQALTGGVPVSPSVRRTLEHLPRGMLYVLAAPFPWDTPKTVQKLTVPDMVLWYVSVVLAVAGLAVARGQWRDLVMPVGYIAGIGLILALVEGNVGTLFRHRAMLVPFTLMFSAAGALWLWDRYAGVRQGRGEHGS